LRDTEYAYAMFNFFLLWLLLEKYLGFFL